MRDPLKDPKKIVELLLPHLGQGLQYFLCANQLQMASARNELMSSSWFFRIVIKATMNEAILALSRLFFEDKRKSYATVYYLLDVVGESPEMLDPEDPEKVSESVADHRRQLEEHETTIEDAIEQRHALGAHISLQHLTDPSAVLTHPEGVEVVALRRCLFDVLAILNFYAAYYDAAFEVGRWESEIGRDVYILEKWMHEYGKLEEWIRPSQSGASMEERAE